MKICFCNGLECKLGRAKKCSCFTCNVTVLWFFLLVVIYLSMYWVNFALDFTICLCQNWGNDLSSHCGIFILVGLSHTKKTGSCAISSIYKIECVSVTKVAQPNLRHLWVFSAVSLSEFLKSQNSLYQCSTHLCKHLQKYWLCATEQYSGLVINSLHGLSPKYTLLCLIWRKSVKALQVDHEVKLLDCLVGCDNGAMILFRNSLSD